MGDEPIPQDEPVPDIPLCPNCMEPTDPNAHTCPKCGAPLTMFATVDPLQTIRSLGWTYRQAASGRSASRIVLIGMWLIFGVAALGILVELLAFAGPSSEKRGVWLSLIAVIAALALVTLYCAILRKTTKKQLEERTRQHEGVEEE